VKLGVMLPTFRDRGEDALAVAAEAERAGLDGVFAFDHLWPMGSPTRPALAPFPVLAAVAARHTTLTLGPLVVRVGNLGTDELVGRYATLSALAPGRVIAALGTGDELSKAEQVAYDLGYPTPDERREFVLDAAQRLLPTMPVWIGAGAEKTNDLARQLGATLNLWGVAPDRVRELGGEGPVSWAGPLAEDPRATLSALADAGATWAVASESSQIDQLKEWRQSSSNHYGL
jgi:alkanesulfonate monooxygenase SsuD/methylene tetrahydromethanopterin reductase-like flavin-dependent oxidoreductase (luciferase family)